MTKAKYPRLIERKPKFCLFCNSNFVPLNQNNPHQKFCSRKCQANFYYRKKISKNNGFKTKKYCKECNSQIIFNTNNPLKTELNRVYCSIKCKIKYNKKYRRIWKKNKYNSNENYRVECLFRSRYFKALKQKRIPKDDNFYKYLGASLNIAKQHLEKNFKKGMSWDNSKKWHIDHIVPISKFDLTNDKDKIRCFNYTNLKPMWAKDNLKKSNKFPKQPPLSYFVNT